MSPSYLACLLPPLLLLLAFTITPTSSLLDGHGKHAASGKVTPPNTFSNDYLCPGTAGGKEHAAAEGSAIIVHLFEWRWEDVARECEEFLPRYGYSAVQVSPPTEHLWRVVDIAGGEGKPRLEDVPWYVRYQPVSYKLESRSGGEAEFKEMVRRCNAAGVKVIVDMVLNHMAGAGQSGANLSSSGHTAFNSTPLAEYFPLGGNNTENHDYFNASHFNDYRCNHDIQPDDYRQHADAVRNCRLVGLVDLNNGHPHVRAMQVGLLNRLLGYGVAGFRFDASKHMWPGDLAAIIAGLQPMNKGLCRGGGSKKKKKGKRPFIVHEVIDKGGEAVSVGEYTHLGRYTNFNYGLALAAALQGWDGGKKNLASLADLHAGYAYGNLASHEALNFVDNHDNQRYERDHLLTHKKPELYRLAVAFMLAWPYGLPRVMSSYEFNHTDQGPPSEGPPTYRTRRVPPFGLEGGSGGGEGGCNGSGWVCEHRWPEIRAMARFRSLTGPRAVGLIHKGQHNVLAFARLGAGYFAANNNDEERTLVNVSTSLPPGAYCNMYTQRDGSNSGNDSEWNECSASEQILVGPDGRATFGVPKRSIVAFTLTSRRPSSPKSHFSQQEKDSLTGCKKGGVKKETVIFMEKKTAEGESLFLRGGTFNASGSDCSIAPKKEDNCSIPIKHCLSTATDDGPSSSEPSELIYEQYRAWAQGDRYLDFTGAESAQGTYDGEEANGTPMRYTTGGDRDKPTFDELHSKLRLPEEGQWKVMLEVDCARHPFFEVKGYLNGKWEPDIVEGGNSSGGNCSTAASAAGNKTPKSLSRGGNHVVVCGAVNVLKWHAHTSMCFVV